MANPAPPSQHPRHHLATARSETLACAERVVAISDAPDAYELEELREAYRSCQRLMTEQVGSWQQGRFWGAHLARLDAAITVRRQAGSTDDCDNP